LRAKNQNKGSGTWEVTLEIEKTLGEKTVGSLTPATLGEKKPGGSLLPEVKRGERGGGRPGSSQ